MAAKFVVSSESGVSATSCTACDDPRHDLVAELLLRADVEVEDVRAGLHLAQRQVLDDLASRASMAAFTGGAMMWMFSPMMSTGGLLRSRSGRAWSRPLPRSAALMALSAGRWTRAGRRRRTPPPAGRRAARRAGPGRAPRSPRAARGEPAGGAIDDQVVSADLGVELGDHGRDAAGRGDTAHRRVADDEAARRRRGWCAGRGARGRPRCRSPPTGSCRRWCRRWRAACCWRRSSSRGLRGGPWPAGRRRRPRRRWS